MKRDRTFTQFSLGHSHGFQDLAAPTWRRKRLAVLKLGGYDFRATSGHFYSENDMFVWQMTSLLTNDITISGRTL